MSKKPQESKSVILNSREIDIPVEWDVVKIEDIAQKTKGKKPDTLYEEPGENRLPYLTISASKGEISQWAEVNDGKRTSSNHVLMVWDGASSGKVFKSKEGIIGSTLASFTFDDNRFDGEFGYYFLRFCEDRISSLTEGTGISHVPRDFTQTFEVLKPPLDEQRRIADILSTVDEQIQQTNQIIELVTRLRRGILNDVISNGKYENKSASVNLGPKSVRKPDSWKIVSIGDVAEVTVGHVSGISDDYSDSGRIPVLSTKNISEAGIDLSEVHYVSESFDQENPGSRASPGDIIMARHGEGGTCAQVPNSLGQAQCLNVVIIKPQKINADFLQHQMNLPETRKRLMSMAGGSVQSVVNTGTIRSFQILLPDNSAQLNIAGIGNTVEELLNIEACRKSELMKLKRGLRQDLLTGKTRINTK